VWDARFTRMKELSGDSAMLMMGALSTTVTATCAHHGTQMSPLEMPEHTCSQAIDLRKNCVAIRLMAEHRAFFYSCSTEFVSVLDLKDDRQRDMPT